MRHNALSLVTLTLALTTACSVPDEVGATGETVGESSESSDDSDPEVDTAGDSGDSEGEPESGEPDDSVPYVGDRMCVIGELTASDVVPEIMLVLDRSSSMVSDAVESYGPEGSNTGHTKWAELHGQVWELLARINGHAEVGMQLFPEQLDSPGQCEVSGEPTVALGENNFVELMNALPHADATGFNGASPAASALLAAADHLQADDDRQPEMLILVTDGAANCGAQADDPLADFDSDLRDIVEDLNREQGIPTFVVGVAPEAEPQTIPAITTQSALSDLATAGGLPMSTSKGFYQPGDISTLARTIEGLTRDYQCTFQNPFDQDFDQLALHFVDQPVHQIEDCSAGTGWTYTDDAQIVLCGGACDAYIEQTPLTVAAPCD